MTLSEMFLKAKGREDWIYGKYDGTEVTCRTKSDLMLDVLFDSEGKWGLKGGNG